MNPGYITWKMKKKEEIRKNWRSSYSIQVSSLTADATCRPGLTVASRLLSAVDSKVKLLKPNN